MRGASTQRDLVCLPSAILCASLMMPLSIPRMITSDGLWTPPRKSKEALTLLTSHRRPGEAVGCLAADESRPLVGTVGGGREHRNGLGLRGHRHKAVFDPDAGGDGHRADGRGRNCPTRRSRRWHPCHRRWVLGRAPIRRPLAPPGRGLDRRRTPQQFRSDRGRRPPEQSQPPHRARGGPVVSRNTKAAGTARSSRGCPSRGQCWRS